MLTRFSKIIVVAAVLVPSSGAFAANRCSEIFSGKSDVGTDIVKVESKIGSSQIIDVKAIEQLAKYDVRIFPTAVTRLWGITKLTRLQGKLVVDHQDVKGIALISEHFGLPVDQVAKDYYAEMNAKIAGQPGIVDASGNVSSFDRSEVARRTFDRIADRTSSPKDSPAAAELLSQLGSKPRLHSITFSAPGGPKILIFRELIESHIKSIPETVANDFWVQLQLHADGYSWSPDISKVSSTSIFRTMKKLAQDIASGQETAKSALSSLAEVIEVAPSNEIPILADYLGFSKENPQQNGLARAVSSNKTIKDYFLMALNVGSYANSTPKDMLASFGEDSKDPKVDALLDKMSAKVFVPGPARSAKSVDEFLSAFGDNAQNPDLPVLLDRMALKVFIPNSKSQFVKEYSGEEAAKRLDTVVASAKASSLEQVSLKVADSRSFYPEMKQKLENKVVRGISIDPNTGVGIEFKGKFLDVEQKFVRMPRMMTNPFFGGLEMNLILEVDGKRVIIPIYNGDSALFIDQP